MPKQVDIDIFCIAQTKVNKDEVRKWLDHLEVSSDYDIGDCTDPAMLVALAANAAISLSKLD
jgi:hypothetical protein